MARYKGQYYKPELKKARHFYQCAVSGLHIMKDSYYLCLEIEDITRDKNGLTYLPTKTIRVSKTILANYSMEEILDRTGLFMTKDEKIKELEETIKLLNEQKIALMSLLVRYNII